MVKHHENLTDRQIKILQTIATEGKQTKSQLSLKFNVKYPAIIGSMKILVARNLARNIETERGSRGKPKLFYEITDFGLEALSNDNRVSLEKFWEIAFLIYGKITKKKTKFSAHEFFSNYEKNVMRYNLEHTTHSWSFIIDAYNILYKRPIQSSAFTMILYILACNGKLSENEIVSKILNSKDIYLSMPTSKDEIIKHLQNMVSNKSVMTIFRKEIKYRISSLGILILFHYFIDTMHENNPVRYKEMKPLLRKIAQKSRAVIPKIFSYWSDLIKIQDEPNLLLRFNSIGDNHLPISDSIQQGGIAELLIMEKMLMKTNLQNIRLEFSTGISTLKKLYDNKKYPQNWPPSQATLRLGYLGILNKYNKDDKVILEKVTKKKNFSFDEEADKSLANLISFEFYLHLMEMMKIYLPRNSKIDPDVSRDSLEPWIKNHMDKWNEFVKSNTEIRIWFEDWVNHIIEFERENIKTLSDRMTSLQLLTI